MTFRVTHGVTRVQDRESETRRTRLEVGDLKTRRRVGPCS